MNTRMVTPKYKSVDEVDAHEVVQVFLAELGKPRNQIESLALQAFNRDDYTLVMLLSATNLSNIYALALMYMAHTVNNEPTMAMHMASAARAIAECHPERKEMITLKLELVISSAFGFKLT